MFRPNSPHLPILKEMCFYIDTIGLGDNLYDLLNKILYYSVIEDRR